MKLLRFTLLSSLALILSFSGFSQKKDDKKTDEVKPTPPVTPKAVEVPKTGPKPYKEVITDKAKTSKGLMTVHKIEEKYFFEIADSLIGREIMTVTRYSKTAAGGSIFGGEEVNSQVIKWEKGPENKIFLRSITLIIASPDSTKPIFQAVKNSSADPIIAIFDIKAMKKDTSIVIDVTDFFKGDNQVFSLDAIKKQLFAPIQSILKYVQQKLLVLFRHRFL
jgi:Domain of unknown function (DUF5117)/Domain of unknown function (DUF5118)